MTSAVICFCFRLLGGAPVTRDPAISPRPTTTDPDPTRAFSLPPWATLREHPTAHPCRSQSTNHEAGTWDSGLIDQHM